MVCISIECANCGNGNLNGFNYNLEVIKHGKSKQCSKCKHVSYPNRIEREYWLCSRKCLMEFLEKHKKEDFKNYWEEQMEEIKNG